MPSSSMFSYLRPHHKRTNSNHATPEPSITPEGTQATAGTLQSSGFLPSFSSRGTDNANKPPGSPLSPYPPTLPPIPRVASRHSPPESKRGYHNSERKDESAAVGGNSGTSGDGQQGPNMDKIISSSRDEADSHGRGNSRQRPGANHTDLWSTTAAPTAIRSQSQKPSGDGSDHQSPQLSRPQSFQASFLQSLPSPRLSSPKLSASFQTTQAAEKHAPAPRSLSFSGNTPLHKSGKTKLNLRNPMSLLLRRRSGQALDHLSEDSLVSRNIVPAMALPDDYDPRIRGKVVHDFSAPREKRNSHRSNLGLGADRNNTVDSDQGRFRSALDGHQGQAGSENVSPSKADLQHTPVFREHFDDDVNDGNNEAAIRAELMATPELLQKMAMPPDSSPLPAPPFGRPSPTITHTDQGNRRFTPPSSTLPSSDHTFTSDPSSNTYEPFPLSPVQESDSPPLSAQDRSSPIKAPKTRSRATSSAEFQGNGFPSRLTSRASRFSFQISAGESTQEKVLEDRHKEQMAKKAQVEAQKAADYAEDEYDEDSFDYDNMDAYDGLEEDIPLAGDDDYSVTAGVANMSLASANAPYSVTGAQPPMLSTDVSGNMTNTQMAQVSTQLQASNLLPDHLQSPSHTHAGHGLGLLGFEAPSVVANAPSEMPAPSGGVADDLGDDLYFDDGMIDAPDPTDDKSFDESAFDDPESHLFERKPLAAVQNGQQPVPSESPPLDEHTKAKSPKRRSTISNDLSQSSHYVDPEAHADPVAAFADLNAYHSALADATNKAAAEGRFARSNSIDSNIVPSTSPKRATSDSSATSRPSLIPDDSRFSQETQTSQLAFSPSADDGFSFSTAFVDDYDYSDYDSALEDDPMIAAANAEALENDYEGEYGQEFGFYANPGGGDAQFMNGGWFGPRNAALGRHPSGRNAVREPNLTPITERSEYSTRNSYISLNHFSLGAPQSGGALPSPGLAQLRGISPYGLGSPVDEFDADRSMSQLLKLRKGAWGGGGGSVSGGSSPRNTSPGGLSFFRGASSPMGLAPMRVEEDVEEEEMEEQQQDNRGGSSRRSGESQQSLPTVSPSSEENEAEMIAASNALDQGDFADQGGWEGDEEEPTITSSHAVWSGVTPSPPPPIRSPAVNHSDIYDNSNSSSPPKHIPSSPPPFHHHPFSSPTRPRLPPITTNPLPDPQPLTSPMLATHNHLNSLAISPTLASPSWKGGPPSSYGYSHSRKGSATADSVAYVRENDGEGKERWVLERRRTAETGELELLTREVVEGGRI